MFILILGPSDACS